MNINQLDQLTLIALDMWIPSPFRRALAYSTMINSSTLSLFSTWVIRGLARVLAEVFNTGLAVRTFRVKLTFSNFD